MGQQVYQHTLPNGLVLLAERMDHVRSAAMNFLVPAGCAYDPPGKLGMASILSEMITRGAGERSSRELSLALDNLGLDRDESVGQLHMRFWGATLARNLAAALEIYADILRRPHLPEDELDAVRSLALQDIRGLEDEPRSKVLVELRKRHYPSPLGNDLVLDTATEMAALKSEAGGDILVHGGNVFVASLLELGLLDELRLSVLPVAIGAGVPLFADLGRLQKLHVVRTAVFPSGIQEVVLEPLHE